MTANFKNVAVFALAAGLLMPTVSLAQEGNNLPVRPRPTSTDLRRAGEQREELLNKEAERRTESEKRMAEGSAERDSKRQEAVCERVANDVERIRKQLEAGQKELSEKNQERKTELASREQEVKKKLEEKRGEAQDKVSEKLTELEEKATAEEKAAIMVFKTAMEAARKIRKAAVDAAQEAFKKAIESIRESRKAEAEAAAETFKTSISEALEEAKSACESGTDPKTVRDALMAVLKAAKDDLQQQRNQLDTKAGVEEAVKTRNAAVRTAHEAFAATLKSELEKLKAALTSGEEQSTETEQE